MSSATKIVAIIPARMGAKRYPGKPLIEIAGLPMIEHVRRRALLCSGFTDVAVATCDLEIKDMVKSYGGRVIMTSPDHAMASDRVAEAVTHVDCTHVINIQGDEILVLPSDLTAMIESIRHSHSDQFWNAIAPIETFEELTNEEIVKCVISTSGNILYCSRNFEHLRLESNFEPVQKILGVLGYTRNSVHKFSQLPRTPLEITQSIDQSRIIEHDYCLRGIRFSSGYPGINTVDEEMTVRDILHRDRAQQNILESINNQ